LFKLTSKFVFLGLQQRNCGSVFFNFSFDLKVDFFSVGVFLLLVIIEDLL